MKCLALVLVLRAVVPCEAQTPCGVTGDGVVLDMKCRNSLAGLEPGGTKNQTITIR